MQDGSASSNSGEPVSEVPENRVDPMSRGPPDNDGNMPTASQSSPCAGLRETTQARSGQCRRCDCQRHQSSISTNSRDSSPPIDEIPYSKSDHVTNHMEREPCSLPDGDTFNTIGNLPWTTVLDTSPSLNPRQQPHKKTRATVTVATLNMRGRGVQTARYGQSKWNDVNKLVKDKKIGILALQEAHLTSDFVEEIHTLFGKRIHVIWSSDPDQPNAKGVTVVINKELMRTNGIESTELIPGHALWFTIPWHKDRKLSLMIVYAPNEVSANKMFWCDLKEIWLQKNLPQLDGLAGDFNMVESAADQMPSHGDDEGSVTALLDLKCALGLIDGWRATNPELRTFTYHQVATGSRSRIDRIYLSENLFELCRDWCVEDPPISTDHRLVSVKLSCLEAPFIG